MTERAYTISEIDAMRGSVESLLTQYDVSYDPKQRDLNIEQRLRTYMNAGIDPAELQQAADRHIKQEVKRSEARRKYYREEWEREQQRKASAEPPPRPPQDKGVDLSGPIWPVFAIVGAIIVFVIGIAAIALRCSNV